MSIGARCGPQTGIQRPFFVRLKRQFALANKFDGTCDVAREIFRLSLSAVTYLQVACLGLRSQVATLRSEL